LLLWSMLDRMILGIDGIEASSMVVTRANSVRDTFSVFKTIVAIEGVRNIAETKRCIKGSTTGWSSGGDGV